MGEVLRHVLPALSGGGGGFNNWPGNQQTLPITMLSAPQLVRRLSAQGALQPPPLLAAPARRAAASPRQAIPYRPLADRPHARRRSTLGDRDKPAAERQADATQRGYDVQDALLAEVKQQARRPHSAAPPAAAAAAAACGAALHGAACTLAHSSIPCASFLILAA